MMGMRLCPSEALRLLMYRQGKSIAQVSREMGYKNYTSLSNILTRGTFKADTVIQVAEICNYKVVLIPENVDVDDAIEMKCSYEEY